MVPLGNRCELLFIFPTIFAFRNARRSRWVHRVEHQGWGNYSMWLPPCLWLLQGKQHELYLVFESSPITPIKELSYVCVSVSPPCPRFASAPFRFRVTLGTTLVPISTYVELRSRPHLSCSELRRPWTDFKCNKRLRSESSVCCTGIQRHLPCNVILTVKKQLKNVDNQMPGSMPL